MTAFTQPESSAPPPAQPDTPGMTMREFLETFGSSLMLEASRLYPPLVTDDQLELPETVLRQPKGDQRLAIKAALAGFESGLRQVFLVAEMGTGKTIMGILIPHLAQYERVLVMCPPHLVQKWAREISITIPGFVHVLESITDVLEARDKTGFFLLSREKAKLGPRWKPAVNSSRRNAGMFTCPECEARLWSVDRTGPRRIALAEVISRRLPKGFFDLTVFDEGHELKSGVSAQGISAGRLAEHSRRSLMLTGTLFGGYASTLFHLLWRFNDAIRERYAITDEKRFIEDYGLLERITTHYEQEDGKTSSRKSERTSSKERPGVNPKILSDLLACTVFLRLTDVGEALPDFEESVLEVAMEPEQFAVHSAFRFALMAEMRQALAKGDKRMLGKAMMPLLHHPDTPFREECITLEEKYGTRVIARATALPSSTLYPKEKALCEFVSERAVEGRKTLIFVQGTEIRDITGRLKGLLEMYGVRTMVLKADTVDSRRREAFVFEHQDRVDALICHPRLVQTGLDLLAFPSIIFYQVEYSTYTLRQAARRSYRIGQTQDVEVVHMAYTDTAQVPALKLIAAKAQKSLALEGELVETGLTNLAEDDVLLALARTLVSGTDPDAELREARVRRRSSDGAEGEAGLMLVAKGTPIIAPLLPARSRATLPAVRVSLFDATAAPTPPVPPPLRIVTPTPRVRLPETQRLRRGHDFTPSLEQQPPALYSTERIAVEEKLVTCKFFLGAFTWYVVECNVEGRAFGYVHNARDPSSSEWGYTDLHELEGIHVKNNVVERDLDWTPTPFGSIRVLRREAA
jgi:Helicase conserved C-terminal domain/Type III restriction enzyme, res subunit